MAAAGAAIAVTGTTAVTAGTEIDMPHARDACALEKNRLYGGFLLSARIVRGRCGRGGCRQELPRDGSTSN